MNRFWGRNEHGGSPRFSRDDDQILALNYENLCDGDYLNRLFGTESISPAAEEPSGNDDNKKGGEQPDAVALSPEMPEDIIIYGNDLKLGRSFCHARYGRQLAASLRHHDSVTSLFNRQAMVFEHIGKLMIHKCTMAPITVSTSKLYSLSAAAKQTDGMVATALDCCLRLLDSSSTRHMSCSNLLPLISLVFHVNQESSIRLKHPAMSGDVTHTLSAEHIAMLRSLFTRAALSCHQASFTDGSHAATEKAFRASMASFYGLLALGLHTGNASEILGAVSHLMLILLRAEEWYEWFKGESKAQLTAAIAAAPSAAVSTPAVAATAEKAQTTVQAPPANGASKLTLKGKAAAEAGKGKATNKVSNPVVPSTSSTNIAALAASTQTPVGKESAAGMPVAAAQCGLPVALLPSGERTVTSANGAARDQPNEAGEARTASAVVDGVVPPVGQIGLYSAHNSSNPNMKSWEGTASTSKTGASKLPAEKDRHTGDAAAVTKKPTKNIKAEARVIQEILDPNMYTAQELSAYYANSSSTVNYAIKAGNNSNNQGGEEALLGKMLSKKGAAGTRSNNQPKTGEAGAQVEGHHRHNSVNNPAAAVARHKKAMLEFKETLQGLLKVPKPVLKVLHDTCASVASATAEQRSPTAAALAAGKTTGEAAAAGGMSTYVWSCGQNSYGELGLGDSLMRKSFVRVACLDEKRVLSIGAGNEHSLFVTQEGKLLTAGYNDNGQCGVGSTQQVRQPTVVAALEDEVAQVHVYNGCEHTLAVTRDGKIYSFGYNYRGQVLMRVSVLYVDLSYAHFCLLYSWVWEVPSASRRRAPSAGCCPGAWCWPPAATTTASCCAQTAPCSPAGATTPASSATATSSTKRPRRACSTAHAVSPPSPAASSTLWLVPPRGRCSSAARTTMAKWASREPLLRRCSRS
jgi:hypothetical protein